MDEMKIVSKFMRGLVSKTIKKALKKSIGYDIDLILNNLYISVDDQNVAHIKLDASADIAKDVLTDIVDKL